MASCLNLSCSLCQAGSTDGGKSGVFSPTGTTANSLLPVLQRVLNGMAEQHESMKEIVAALQDSDKGKSASLASLLAQHQERNPAELLISKPEVKPLGSPDLPFSEVWHWIVDLLLLSKLLMCTIEKLDSDSKFHRRQRLLSLQCLMVFL